MERDRERREEQGGQRQLTSGLVELGRSGLANDRCGWCGCFCSKEVRQWRCRNRRRLKCRGEDGVVVVVGRHHGGMYLEGLNALGRRSWSFRAPRGWFHPMQSESERRGRARAIMRPSLVGRQRRRRSLVALAVGGRSPKEVLDQRADRRTSLRLRLLRAHSGKVVGVVAALSGDGSRHVVRRGRVSPAVAGEWGGRTAARGLLEVEEAG